MCPRYRAASGGNTAIPHSTVIIIAVSNNAMLMGITMVLSITCISPGKIAIFLAPQRDSSPFRICHQMPTFSLVLAIVFCLIKCDIDAGVLKRQAVCPLILHNILIFADINFRYFHAIYDKCRMGTVRATRDNIADLKFWNANHKGRHPFIII